MIPTDKLLDEEAKIAAERRALLSKITLEVEAIFLREDLTMQELSEVLDLFNARAHSVFSRMKLSAIKETYDRRTR